ncbi:MAG: hypothetical protein DCC43_10970, partial [Candidatus Brocadia sp.]
GVRGHMRTLQPGRTQVNIISSRKREHSRKPNQIYDVIENCSPGPYLELFARFRQEEWDQWGNEDVEKNSLHGVARRKGHGANQMRLFERPVQYEVNKASNKSSVKKRKSI